VLGLLIPFPAAAHPAAAALWRQATHQDTTAAHQRLLDSVVVKSPLPDPLVPIVQWIFQKPSWLMATGIVLAAVAGLAVLVVAWRKRRAIGHWLATRDRAVKFAIGGSVAALLALAAAAAFKSYHYVMHDNGFCSGCHIFVPSGGVFVPPDTGSYLLVNKQEGKHDKLECHACHPFAIRRQTKTLVAWILARPQEIPPHGKVPRKICEQCHVTGPAKDTWKRITTTAGHRTHLESDLAALRDVTCLTCHARTAHRFQPADTTCAQKGCHLTDSVKIRLGRMAARFQNWKPQPNEQVLYCNSCHQFTADAQFLAPDSALGLLRPTSRNCFKCHEMRTLLATYDPAREPHGGGCGMCHNPHTNVKPADALKSCTDAQCHANWRDVDFHTGATHRKVAEHCETCHAPHSARVDASDCVGCHRSVRYGPRSRLRPPLPFDTTAALRQTSWRDSRRAVQAPAHELESRTRLPIVLARFVWAGPAPPRDDSPGRGTAVSALASDTFPHARHSRLPCLTCHDLRAKGRTLTFEPPRGCQICHHQRSAQANCRTCHQQDELTPTVPVQVAVAVPRHDRRRRTVQFEHAKHDTLACTGCHVTPVTMAPADSVQTCTACHAKHHAQSRNCAACHRTAAITAPHRLPVQAHTGCDACHTPATVARLVPKRAFCLACHQPEQDHYGPRECSACHFQRSPAELQPKLTRGPPS
jgi:hypothetical protein